MTKDEARNLEIMQRWFHGGVWNTDDDAAAEAFIDRHYASDGLAFGIAGSYEKGPASFKAFRRLFLDAFPDVKFELTHIQARDDQVSLRWVAQMTGATSDTPIEIDGGGFVEMAGDQIVKAWNFINFAELLTQLGVLEPGAAISALQNEAK